MFKLIPANKPEHPRFSSLLVCTKDWESGSRVATPVKSGELVAQGPHRVRVPNFDDVHFVIRLRRGSLGQLSVRKKWRDLERTTSLTVKPPHRY